MTAPDEFFQKSLWLVAYVDRANYDLAQSNTRWRLATSLGIMLAALLLGLALLILALRQNRLAAELTLGHERERQLEERSQLGAGLAHETKNPLCLIRGLAQSMLNQEATDVAEKSPNEPRQIIDEVDRVVGRINSFLEYARSLSPHAVEVDLEAALRETVHLFQDEAASKGVRLETALQPARAKADPGMLRQIMVNLLANALAATAKGDTIRVALDPAPQGQLVIAVEDSGEGIVPDDLAHVVKPYFSRRDAGTGLGLSIVDQIAQSHGWRLEINSIHGQGAVARIANIQAL